MSVTEKGYKIDTRQLLTPELYEEGKRPSGPVQFDRNHWMWPKMNCFWYPSEKSGVLRDLIQGLDMVPMNDTGNDPQSEFNISPYTSALAARGRSTDPAASSLPGYKGYYKRVGADGGNYWKNGNTKVSVFAYLTVHDVVQAGEDGRVMSQDIGTGEVDHYWMIGWSSSRAIRCRFKGDSNSTDTAVSPGGKIQDGETFLLIGDYDSTDMNIRAFMVDDMDIVRKNQAHVTGGAAHRTLTTDAAIMSTAESGHGNYTNISFYWGGLYSGLLTDGECWDLLRRPYQMLAPIL